MELIRNLSIAGSIGVFGPLIPAVWFGEPDPWLIALTATVSLCSLGVAVWAHKQIRR